MDQFIGAHCLRIGRTRVSDFMRALQDEGIDLPRSQVIAGLRDFRIVRCGGQDVIDGLCLRVLVENSLRRFIEQECLRADGLSCRLTTVARGSGLTRAQTAHQLARWGFTINQIGCAHVVRGLGLKEEGYE
jgi:hypothetical protein